MLRKKWLKVNSVGFALALVIMTLIILLVTGAGLLSLGMHSRMFAVRTCSGTVSYTHLTLPTTPYV